MVISVTYIGETSSRVYTSDTPTIIQHSTRKLSTVTCPPVFRFSFHYVSSLHASRSAFWQSPLPPLGDVTEPNWIVVSQKGSEAEV